MDKISQHSSIMSVPMDLNWSPDYKTLNQLASDDDLVHLTNHENPFVKVYAFNALTNRGYKDIRKIFLKYRENTQIVETNNGACIIDQVPLNQYLLEILSPVWKSKYCFNDREYDSIRSIMLQQ